MVAPADLSPIPQAEAPRDCPLCPRLVRFRLECRAEHPDWWNAPVPAFGDPDAWLAIVGLAPGKHGANRTGRPFTGDHAGILLYQTLHRYGYGNRAASVALGDGLELAGCRITNAVKCLPPENKPLPAEVKQCNAYLRAELAALAPSAAILALGAIAHQAVLMALGLRRADYPFGHAAIHELPDGRTLFDSYHCSRYNTQTRRLTEAMFFEVFERIGEHLSTRAAA